MSDFFYRAGYPDRSNPRFPFRRFGRWWLRVGPYVIGNVDSWDRSNAP